MTQDEIIRMAREAGLQHIPIDLDYPVIGKTIERFAALVAANEREACAKVCESMYNSPTFSDEYIECADAIRARNSHEKTN